MSNVERLAEWLATVESGDGDEVALLLTAAKAITIALQLINAPGRVGGGGKFGGAGASGDYNGKGPQWVEPEVAAKEFGLDCRRLCRNWRRLGYCRARDDGGRGFIVDRWALKLARQK